MARKLALSLNAATTEAEVEHTPSGPRVRLGDQWFDVDFAAAGGHGLYSLLIDGRSYEVYAQPRSGGFDVLIGNRVFSVDSDFVRGKARPAGPAEPEGVWVLRSPMAGLVVQTLVAAGDEVRAGQLLLLVESMKMNNELSAARAGAVTEVYVSAGQRVDRGAPLIRVE